MNDPTQGPQVITPSLAATVGLYVGIAGGILTILLVIFRTPIWALARFIHRKLGEAEWKVEIESRKTDHELLDSLERRMDTVERDVDDMKTAMKKLEAAADKVPVIDAAVRDTKELVKEIAQGVSTLTLMVGELKGMAGRRVD